VKKWKGERVKKWKDVASFLERSIVVGEASFHFFTFSPFHFFTFPPFHLF